MALKVHLPKHQEKPTDRYIKKERKKRKEEAGYVRWPKNLTEQDFYC